MRAGNYLYFIANSFQFGEEVYKILISANSETQWIGNTSTNWQDAGNWSNGIPNTNSEVIIPSGRPRYPVITINTVIKKLTIISGASVEVATSVQLTLTN